MLDLLLYLHDHRCTISEGLRTEVSGLSLGSTHVQEVFLQASINAEEFCALKAT